ncbi:CBS domain-containing protein [Palleronia aestuarii]|uniref:CBS domain-containing protein n=1 Tax=Palleronia aestuarii TaxID=568105 RepID=A0A2W7Q9G4_9RHOB|nr:CBS domain-containing protein [Palleronia aestuarii]PZX18349.1 CBS domain-containing protein [Palleronia aestuarii]
MRVQQILGQKGNDGVITMKPGTSVAEAVALLSGKRIGAVIISDGGAPRGILSERDIVRELGRRGAKCLDDHVETMMTKDLITCAPDDDAHDVLTKMTEGRFRHMPVIEGGEMVGLISIGDVVKARLAELSMERDALEGMVRGF